MTTNVSAVLNSGACNSTVARYLNKNDFVVYTYGWDELRNGHYYRYDDDSREWFMDDSLLEIVPAKETTPDFHYRNQVTPAVVATLKRMCR